MEPLPPTQPLQPPSFPPPLADPQLTQPPVYQPKRSKAIIGLTAFALILVIGATSALSYRHFFTDSNNPLPLDSNTPSQSVLSAPETTPTTNTFNTSTLSDTITPPPTPSPTPRPTLPPTPQPTSPPTPAPTPTPRTPTPPIMRISYPSENQDITFSSPGQQFCLVDVPVSGKATQRKHKINNDNWTDYSNLFTLCFEPAQGSNTISLRYRNSYGDESEEYTRHFSFHRP